MKLLTKYLLLVLLPLTFGCATESKITLEPVNKTEMECDIIFADSRKTIMELNEVLIQKGMLFTPNEREVVIIHIGGTKQELALLKEAKSKNHINQVYANKDYKLELNYDQKYPPAENINAKEPYYEGECRLWHNGTSSKMSLYGLSSFPDMF